MVKLEEVTEGHEDFSDGETSDNDSNYSSDDSDSEDLEESILERILALRDIMPEDTRESISNKISTIMSFGVKSARFLGNGAWILTTSALLIFMPLAYEIEREHAFDQAYSQMENEQLMNQGNNPYGQPGQPVQPGQQSIPPGQHQPRGALIPPGF
uniref:Mitochondrial import receptor subunit tom22 n=1 Tax=Anthurium amnicola TaxID=1678845 RepID=A0A1D1XPG2_9ARAE